MKLTLALSILLTLTASASAQTPQETSQVVRDSLRSSLSQPLTRQQRAVIKEAIVLASPEAYSSLKDVRPRAQLLNQRIAKAFPLGTDIFIKAPQRSLRKFRAHRAAVADCGCATGSDWCSSGFNCVYSQTCTHTTFGCGTLLFFECDGNCVPNNPDRPEPSAVKGRGNGKAQT